MNVKLVFKVLGHILRIESVFLLLPAMVALASPKLPMYHGKRATVSG